MNSQQALFKPANLVLATIAISLASFMQVLDTTIANVALPTIAGNLGVSSEQGTWVITSFAVCNAITLPLTGWMSRRIGEVKLFISVVLLFVITSFLCGIATSMTELIIFRCLQGAVAGPLYPIAQSLLLAIYPPIKRGVALAILSIVTVVAPIAGPILGGWISYNYTWPWIFFINIPFGLFAVFFAYQQMKTKSEVTQRLPIDYIGLISLVIGVGALQIILDKGNDLDWFESNFIIFGSVVAVIGIAFFITWELTDTNPIVNLKLFINKNFSIGCILLVFGYAGFFGINLLLPQWLQTQMGYTATWAGLAAAPIGVIPILLTPFLGRYAHYFDMRLLASIAFAAIGFSCFMRAGFNTQVNYQHIAFVQLFMGIGVALFFMPVMSIVLSEIKQHQIAEASGLAAFLRTLGGSFAASLTTWIWTRNASLHHAYLTENTTLYDPTTLHTLNQLGGKSLESYAKLENIVNSQAYMLSTVDYFNMLGFGFILLIVVAWLASSKQKH